MERLEHEADTLTAQAGALSRTASFDKSRHRMLIEWSVAKNGAVTGLVVRPEVVDSARQ